MGDIDRQRVAPVKTLRELGMTWHHGAWQKVPQGEFVAKADAVHAQLIGRADDLAGCTGGSPEAAELAAITEVLEDYELKRRPVRPDYPASRASPWRRKPLVNPNQLK